MKNKFLFSLMFLFFFLFFARGGWLPTDVRLDTGDPPGAHSSGYVQICNNGDNVYVVWSDSRNGTSDIYFSYSNDRGETWQNPVRIDTKATPGSHQSWEPKMSVSGSYVYVVWRDWRNGLGDIYFNSSSDDGVTWQASDIRLDTGDSPGAHISGHPEISSSGTNVYVTWNEDRDDGPDIYFNYSNDGGITWQEPFRIDTKATPGATASEWPQICSSGSNVYVAWQEARIDGYTAKFIFFNYSTDGGATWQDKDIQLDTGGLPEDHWSDAVDVCCSGTNVYAVWEDERNGEDDIYFNYSTDGGVTWEASSIRIDTGDLPGANASGGPRLTISGNHVYIVWLDERDNQYTTDVYFNGSKDGGLNWQAPVRINTGDNPGANDSYDPQICSSGTNVYVVWFDERNGEHDIFFNCSTDGGITWKTPDVRLDTGDIPGANESTNPQLSCSENTVYVVWSDRRNGETDIYFNTFAIPAPDIKANDSDEPITIIRSDTLSITVELYAGTLLGKAADLWLVAHTPLGWYHYDRDLGWLPEKEVTLQIPLRDIPTREVLNMSGLPPGSYTFYFGVDLVKNGSIDVSQAYYDKVKVTINP